MKKFCLLLLLLIPSTCWAAAWVSTQEGNWSGASNLVGSPWYDGGAQTALARVPQDGDTVTVSHNVTVDEDTTVGTSPDDSTTNVLTISGATGRVIVASGVNFTVRGNVYNNAGAAGALAYQGIQLSTGSTLKFDASACATSTRRYNISCGSYASMGFSGMNASRVTVTATTNTWTINSGQGTVGSLEATYTDFSKSGGAAQYAAYLYANTNNGPVRLDHCTFDNSGSWSFNQSADTRDCYVQNSSMTNTLPALNSMVFNFRASATALKYVASVVTDKAVSFGSNPAGGTVTSCYFGLGCYAQPTAGADFASFQNNLIRTTGASASAVDFYASLSNCYLLKDSNNTNPSILTWYTGGANRSITDSIIDYTYSATTGDFIIASANSAHSQALSRNILLPNSTGNAGGKFVSIFRLYSGGTARPNGANPTVVTGTGSSWLSYAAAGDMFKVNTGAYMEIASVDSNTQLTLTGVYDDPGSAVAYTIDRTTNNSIAVNNNTIAVCASPTNETGIGTGESDSGKAGEVTSLKSNLFWTAAAGSPGWKMVRQQSTRQDFASSANCDYNWSWNLAAGTEGDGYNCQTGYTSTSMFSSGAPDAHGGTGDPRFVDSARNMATYDIAGLGNAPGTAWTDAAGPDYAVGEVVSNSDASYYSNMVVNYRCVLGHAKGTANSEPGVGSAWHTYWEFQSLYRLRENTSRILHAINWIKKGMTPLSGALKGIAHDGGDIGAVPVYKPRPMMVM